MSAWFITKERTSVQCHLVKTLWKLNKQVTLLHRRERPCPELANIQEEAEIIPWIHHKFTDISLHLCSIPQEADSCSCGLWALGSDAGEPWGDKALVCLVCRAGHLALGWPGGSKAPPWKKTLQKSQFPLFHFVFSHRRCLPLPRLQNLPAQKHGRKEALFLLFPMGQVQQLSFKLQLYVSWRSWMCMFQPWPAAGWEAKRSQSITLGDIWVLPLVMGGSREKQPYFRNAWKRVLGPSG